MKSLIFQKINKINKFLGRPTNIKPEDPNKIRNNYGDITTEMQRIMTEYNEHLYANKLKHLEEINLWTHTIYQD